MRLFLDTNIFPEFIDRRNQFDQVCLLIDAIHEGKQHFGVEQAIYNVAFTDIEDSFQYQCAIDNDCDVLITINIDDYKDSDHTQMEILTPSEFVDKYISVEP